MNIKRSDSPISKYTIKQTISQIINKHDTGCGYGKSARNSTELTETLEKYWYSANYSLDSLLFSQRTFISS